MITTKRPNASDYTQVGFIEAKDDQGNYQNIDHIYDSEGNIVFQQGYLNEYDGANDFSIPAIGKPLIDYTIYGNTFQDGIPTPNSPIMPEGTGERTGNLFDYKTAYASYINADGDVAATTLGTIRNSLADFVGQTITIRVYCKTVTATRVYVTSKIGSEQKSSNSIYQGNTGYMTLTVTPETADDYWNVSYGSLGTENNIYSDFMVNTGSTALPYEPYGYKIPISSANTTTPIYLGEVESTRRIKKYEFTGQESITADLPYSRFIFTLNDSLIIGVRKTPAFCTHWQVIDDGRTIANVPNNALYSDSENSRWFIKTTDYTTANDLKSYLAAQYAAGTPVTVWYVLATEETAVVNEPLMKIGNYADTLSYEQAGVEIPTLKRPNTTEIDITTSLPPSEVYAKYRGSKTQKIGDDA